MCSNGVVVMRLFFAACLGAVALASAGAVARPSSSRAAAFEPQVSVWISDDAPGSHPDITTTIDLPGGAPLLRVETLTPPGGGIHRWGDIPEGIIIGWIGGFSTIPGPDGQCNQRFLFNNVPLVEANPDSATFPPFLQQLAPGAHRVRYTADAPGTPVNIIVDEVQMDGAQRLRATTFIGDPAKPVAGCAPFRSRVFMYGDLHSTPPMPPVGTAPLTAGPRSYEFKFTSRDGDVVERSGTATVEQGLRPRLEGDRVAWNSVPGLASLGLGGSATYTTTCPLIRRLVIRQESRDIGQKLPADATTAQLPAPPSADYELAQIWAEVSAFDADGVLLARDDVDYTRDFASCWYPPGEEPLLHVAPEAGSCIGNVTFTGERFPTGVNVEITVPPYGSDVSGPRVAVALVAADGTFSARATLPESACTAASIHPGGRMLFWAYNADEPKGMTTFAGASYDASLPPGWTPPSIMAPVTGTGPEPTGAWWQLAAMLAIAGAVVLGGGVMVRRS